MQKHLFAIKACMLGNGVGFPTEYSKINCHYVLLLSIEMSVTCRYYKHVHWNDY